MKKTCTVCSGSFEGFGGNKFCSIRCNYESHVIKHGEGCWGWQGSTSNREYGQIIHGRGNYTKAHRFSYETFVGPIPKGLNVLHACDNPRCSRPEHLFVGTQLDNHKDARQKGRWRKPPTHHGDAHPARKNPECVKRGAQHGMALLSEKQVRKILKSKAKGIVLAKKYNVSPATISAIRVGRLWKHLSRS